MVFGIVHQTCSAVPGHDVALFNAVPQQHAASEHFAQTGAAQHPALFNHCPSLLDWHEHLIRAGLCHMGAFTFSLALSPVFCSLLNGSFIR
jgi:hypothetical protein